ncbi:growth arrest and DNA damage-inducible protein GADD45 gamma [Eurosta solidaginis]|uniref:growth arrest and DNA damage-inducible protein GADD45 gamma n=1 Tax=Eurosta solidaginis TaxID=178769 RepID=UPI003530BD91
MVVNEAHIQHYRQNLEGLNLKLEQHLEDIQNLKNSTKQKQMEFSKIGRIIKSALLNAQTESRVIVGLSAAIQVLSKNPEGTLFCIMAVPKNGDAATHMQEVLLEAFCYEHDIYVIKVDCPTKLSRILGKTEIETCCLVQKPWSGGDDSNVEELLNKQESVLVDYCEAFWDAPKHPIVELPVV